MFVQTAYVLLSSACRNKQRTELTQSETQELVNEAWGDVPQNERQKVLLQYMHVVTNVR
jgi:hypothetical protein